MATIHFSLFTCCFHKLYCIHSLFFLLREKKKPNSHTHTITLIMSLMFTDSLQSHEKWPLSSRHAITFQDALGCGKNQIQGAECPWDRRDIWRDRWDMSMGQTGHTTGGVPPNSLCLLISSFPKNVLLGKEKEEETHKCKEILEK